MPPECREDEEDELLRTPTSPRSDRSSPVLELVDKTLEIELGEDAWS